MPIERADAHIHLFEHGYQGSFTGRPGVSIDEAACYQSLAGEHGVTSALVVGYGAEPWCTDNNQYIAGMAAKHKWVYPAAFVHLQRPLRLDDIERLKEQRFIGLSFYVFTDSDIVAVAQVSDEIWSWLEKQKWLISINSRGVAWRVWQTILERHPHLRLLISHLGLPPQMPQPPSPEAARASLSDVLALARFANVHVKVSGFYVLTEPGHDYPHRAAWPYAEVLWQTYGTRRLLWASDFAPCLDWLTFPQTMGVVETLPFLNNTDRAAITGGNLLALLRSAERAES